MTKDEALTLALEALERASHSLGSFVSDHGWGQEDMNTLDSVMAAEHRIKEALAQPEQCEYCNRGLKAGLCTCTPPQSERPWVGLTGQEKALVASVSLDVHDAVHRTDAKLKEKNT